MEAVAIVIVMIQSNIFNMAQTKRLSAHGIRHIKTCRMYYSEIFYFVFFSGIFKSCLNVCRVFFILFFSVFFDHHFSQVSSPLSFVL